MQSISTPDLSCISEKDKERVYEPAEDSFLLLDALEVDRDLIVSRKPTLVLEVGCGSGVVSVFMSKLLGKAHRAHILCTDINRDALDLTNRLANHNGQRVEPVLMDLANCFGCQQIPKLDVVLFNPPYVVTPSEEVGSRDLAASWAGGVYGREVLDRLLPEIPHLLSPHGLFYLIALEENRIDEIEEILGKCDLAMQVVLERRSGPERLKALRFEMS